MIIKCVLFVVILHYEDDIKTVNNDNCFDKKELILVDNYQMTCQNCGTVDHYIYKNNYIDFYEHMYKIRKKSVYIRKYHIINVLNEIGLSNKKPIPSFVFNNVLKMFDKIKNILPQILNNVNELFLLNILFIVCFLNGGLILKLKSRNPKRLHDYEKYWNKPFLLIEQ